MCVSFLHCFGVNEPDDGVIQASEHLEVSFVQLVRFP